MTKQEKEKYSDGEELKIFLHTLKGRKFRLDCGHHVTFMHTLGNDIAIKNGGRLRIICSLCDR